MSANALLSGVEARLRSVLSDPNGDFVGVQIDGRPPPFAGQWYYAIWWAGSRQTDQNPLSHDAGHSVTVTITARVGYAPKDRRGPRLRLDTELIGRAEVIAAGDIIHGNYAVLASANALIPGTAEYVALHGGSATVNGFIEPLCLGTYGPVQLRGGEWVGSDDANPPTVLTVDVPFTQARRVQRF